MYSFLLIDGKHNSVEVPISHCTELLKRIRTEDINKNKSRNELNASVTRFLEKNGDRYPGRRKIQDVKI